MLDGLWRLELLHPLVVHFAVSVLILGTLFWPARWLDPESRFGFLCPLPRVLLILGVMLGWLAVLTGEWAYSEVAGTLCVPNVADYHQINAYRALWVFTAGMGVDLLRIATGFGVRFRSLLNGGLLIVFLVGSGFLIRAGEYGAHLVYEQAAAVHAPDAQCSRFE